MTSSAYAFDRAYYRRFYEDRATRVASQREADRLSEFVGSYARYLGVRVRRVLDLGCGLGLWRSGLERVFPSVRYHGVEVSDYLCERFGWEPGSVVDYEARRPYDLVVCQGVLPYLGPRDARRAMANLARLCAGVLYVEAVTREDWDGGAVDRRLTDASMHFRPRAFYVRGLRPGFVQMGGGVWLARSAQRPVYALERV